VFKYIDTASTRAEIGAVTAKLATVKKVAIVGLGGTGSYVLDLVAKTPVREIHLFDGDDFLQHNAFRSPGAPSLEELVAKPKKAAYLKGIYDKMRNGIFVHERLHRAGKRGRLRDMSFVFMCLEGPAKQLIVEKLEEFGLPFIDVGMGVYLSEGSLGGILRVTTSTPAQRDHVRKRVSFADDADRNEYDQYPDRRPERAERGAGGDQVEKAGGLLPGSRLRASLHLYDRRQYAAQRRCAGRGRGPDYGQS
jgi:hypothetical protein